MTLAAYSPDWPEEFVRERRRLAGALGGLAREIEHIGSTAVEGLVAKPLIDVVVGLHSYDQWALSLGAMKGVGYECLGEFGIAGRQFFLRGDPTTHHVHMCEHGGRFWYQTLLFRDHIRERPEVCERYAELKRELAAQHADNREAYTTGKSEFIQRVLREAGWTP